MADYNGNGYMSLAELDAYIEKKLRLEYPKKDAGLLLWKAFRPSYIRAFMDAKDVLEDKAIKGTRSTTDDYITFGQFKVALHYVCLYALMHDSISEIDPEAVFAEIDANGGGFILLNEWCEWLEKKEAEAGTEFGRILTLGEE